MGFFDDILKSFSPKDKRKATPIVEAAKKVSDPPATVVKKDGSVKTWAELGEELGIPEWKNIPEPPPTPGVYASKQQFNKWFNRSQKAQGLEKEGKVEQAMRLYQQNVDECSEIPIDYERLAIIQSKRGDLAKAIYYCELALRSPACTNPAQETARRSFTLRRDKLVARLEAKRQK